MKNNYYDIAINDLRYLEIGIHSEFYNNLSVSAQQVAEKMLKSVLNELVSSLEPDVKNLLQSHNLRTIYDKIHSIDKSYILDRNALSTLKDYYFDAKYPGENFITVTEKECYENLSIMYSVVEATNTFRKKNGLTIYEVQNPIATMQLF